MNCFYYYKDLVDVKFNNQDKNLLIPKYIDDKFHMFDFYEKNLNIPSDFGKNWNAFFDNLKGFDFITEKNVTIIHQDIPFKNDEESKRIYTEIMFDTICFWQEFSEHKFYVYFPESCREEVVSIMDSFGDDE